MKKYNFNPRSPYGERHARIRYTRSSSKFQSTLPLRGATVVITIISAPIPFQSTLPLRGATSLNQPDKFIFSISIHAPLTGSDGLLGRECSLLSHFNPRSPYGERLLREQEEMDGQGISIHAPLTGSDLHHLFAGSVPADFNPRSPYGERPISSWIFVHLAQFQSTLPLRGATLRRR